MEKSIGLRNVAQAVMDDLSENGPLPWWSAGRWFGKAKREAEALRAVDREYETGVLVLLNALIGVHDGVALDKMALREMPVRLVGLEMLRASALHVCSGGDAPFEWNGYEGMNENERYSIILGREARALLVEGGTGRFTVNESITGAIADSLNAAISLGLYAQKRAGQEAVELNAVALLGKSVERKSLAL
jgi:hypothetical protein